jgi:putative peptidoglycan lipid II flippase
VEETSFTRRSATFIGSFTLAARIVERLGAFALIVLVASVYGSSSIADRYFIASITPLIIGAVAGETLSANILPALVRSAGEPRRLVAAGFWLAGGLLLLVTIGYLAIATVIVRSASPAGSSSLAVWIAFAPIAPLLGLAGYLSGVLTYFERYVWPPFRSSIATVGGFLLTLVVIAFTRDVAWVAAAVTGGYALSFAALAVEIRGAAGHGGLARPDRGAAAEAFSLRGGLTAPIVGGLLGGQVFVLLERTLAASVGVGAVAALSYARGVVFTPLILAQAIALGLYPGMLRAYEARDLEHVRGSLVRGLRLTLFSSLALAAFFAMYGRETVDVLLERGEFGARAAGEVGSILAAFSLALVGSMLMVFVARIFYAVDYFRAVVWVQVSALAAYAAIAVPLREVWGTTGLALTFGIAEVSAATFALGLAFGRVGLDRGDAIARAVVPAVGRACIVAAAVGLVRIALAPGQLGATSSVRFAVGASVGILSGSAALWRAGWPELSRAQGRLRRFVRSRAGSLGDEQRKQGATTDGDGHHDPLA